MLSLSGSGLETVVKELDSKLRSVEGVRLKDATTTSNKIKELDKKLESMDMHNRIKTIQVRLKFIFREWSFSLAYFSFS